MLKSIKIPEDAYNDAKKLSEELEKNHIIEGLYDVKLSTAISYAIKKTLDEVERRKAFLSSSGGWRGMDQATSKRIYDRRRKGTKWDRGFD